MGEGLPCGVCSVTPQGRGGVEIVGTNIKSCKKNKKII
jgi:hypothetical protein